MRDQMEDMGINHRGLFQSTIINIRPKGLRQTSLRSVYFNPGEKVTGTH
jgi:hypothetical protein